MNTASKAAAAAALYAAFRVAADLGDHHIQTDHQAVNKAKPGMEGYKAVAAHAATYGATQAAAALIANRALNLGVAPTRIIQAVLLASASHAFIDRRWPVKRLAQATGKSNFYELGGPLGGAYLLDQALHHLAEGAAVLWAVRTR